MPEKKPRYTGMTVCRVGNFATPRLSTVPSSSQQQVCGYWRFLTVRSVDVPQVRLKLPQSAVCRYHCAPFLSRVDRTRDIDIPCHFCLSVSLSVECWYCVDMVVLVQIVKLFYHLVGTSFYFLNPKGETIKSPG